MLCACGCGLETNQNNSFFNGHNRRGAKLSSKTKEKMSLVKKGKKLNRHSYNFIPNKPVIVCETCGKTVKVIPSCKDQKYCSRKCKKMGMMRPYDERYGVEKSIEIRQKQSKRCEERWNDAAYKNHQSNKMIERWKNQEYAKKVMHRREMSKPEKEFQKIIDENSLPFYFNGTLSLEGRELTINRKVPDFVHNSENKLIEIWGDYFHKGQNPQDRIDLFKERDYDCLVLWASELKDTERTLNKIYTFLGEKEKC